MISVLVMARPGWFTRLWMRVSPTYDETKQDERAKRLERVRLEAISTRLRVEGLIARRDAAALRGYRAERGAMRRPSHR